MLRKCLLILTSTAMLTLGTGCAQPYKPLVAVRKWETGRKTLILYHREHEMPVDNDTALTTDNLSPAGGLEQHEELGQRQVEQLAPTTCRLNFDAKQGDYAIYIVRDNETVIVNADTGIFAEFAVNISLRVYKGGKGGVEIGRITLPVHHNWLEKQGQADDPFRQSVVDPSRYRVWVATREYADAFKRAFSLIEDDLVRERHS